MTVSNQTNSTSVTGTGIVQIIPFSFPIVNNSDIIVYKRLISTGVETELAETTDYIVSNNGSSGGSITTVTPFIAATYTIHIERNTPMTQTLNLEQGGSFNAENIEAALDKNTRLIVENGNKIKNKALTFPATDGNSITSELPSTIDRASKVLSFDLAGNATASSAVPTGSLSFTDIGTSIAEAANASAIRALLEFPAHVNVQDYGAVGDDDTDDTTAIRDALTYAQANDLPLFFPPCSVRYKITGYLEITTDDTRIICSYNQSPIRQDTWGKPVFYVRADDVSIIDPYMISTETRSTLSGDLSSEGEGSLAAKEFSAGIFISKFRSPNKADRFYVNKWYAEGFQNGIFATGIDGTNPMLDVDLGDGHVDTVDQGILLRAFYNLRIDSLLSVDLDRSQGVAVHGIYTIATQANPNKGLSIGQLTARNNYDGDHAFQIKYTEDIVIGTINATECSHVLNIEGYCNGSIGSISAKVNDQGANSVIVVQANSKIIIGNIYIEGPWTQQGVSVTSSSKLIVNSAYMVHTGEVALNNNVFYSTGGSTLEVYNPRVEFTTAPTNYVFDTSSDANTVLRVFNPTITGIGAACKFITLVSGIDLSNSVLSFDPKLISNVLVTSSIVMADDTGPYNINFLGETATAVVMETAQATPIVNYATYFTITNTSAKSITDFTRIPRGHRFTVEASGDSNTTFVHEAGKLELFNSHNYTLNDGDRIEFIERGGVICETWRSKVSVSHIVCNENQGVCNENQVVVN